jgi:NADPH-dependent curcumin reductase CurA
MAKVWHVAQRPRDSLCEGVFELRDVLDQPLSAGEVRIRNTWLSADPYIRGMLDDAGSYMPTLPLGSPVPGGAVGTVVETRDANLEVGATVLHDLGWRDMASLPASACFRIDGNGVKSQLYLGHLGMPGQTAYFGLLDVLKPREGETLFVSAAAGAVGSAVVQIAKIKRVRVVASAGGAEKCAMLRTLGADVAIDRRANGSMREKLADAAPDGIDLYFDNVGGDHLDAALESAKIGARMALCGMISGYGSADGLTLPDPMRLVVKHIRMRGFTAPEFNGRKDEFEGAMLEWIRMGLIQSPDTVLDGLHSMPLALEQVLSGGNVGKLLVRV